MGRGGYIDLWQRHKKTPAGRTSDGLPLISRLKYEGAPSVSLSDSQINALRAFKEKCKDGVYQFEKTTCPCGTGPDRGILLACQDRYGLAVYTYICPRCGILWSSPRMTADSLIRFYKSDYRAIYTDGGDTARSEFETKYRYGQKVYEFVYPFFNGSLSPPVVFDIGCGTGGILKVFAEHGWQTIGCDFDEGALEIGQKAGLTMIKGDAGVLQEYAPADLIIACQTLEHIPEPIQALQGWGALLKERGYLYVETPGVLRSYETYGDFTRLLQNAHLYYFTLGTLTGVLAKAGFSFIKGDEQIRAIFKKTDGPVPPSPDKNELRRILSYLKRSEMKLLWRRAYRRGFGLLRTILGRQTAL